MPSPLCSPIETAPAYHWSFSAFRSLDIGYNRIVFHNASHLEIDFFSVTKQVVVDRFWIVKGDMLDRPDSR
jgi:hypothetical protein